MNQVSIRVDTQLFTKSKVSDYFKTLYPTDKIMIIEEMCNTEKSHCHIILHTEIKINTIRNRISRNLCKGNAQFSVKDCFSNNGTLEKAENYTCKCLYETDDPSQLVYLNIYTKEDTKLFYERYHSYKVPLHEKKKKDESLLTKLKNHFSQFIDEESGMTSFPEIHPTHLPNYIVDLERGRKRYIAQQVISFMVGMNRPHTPHDVKRYVNLIYHKFMHDFTTVKSTYYDDYI